MMKKQTLPVLSLCMSLIALAGCGGGSGSPVATGAGRATVLLTDSFREDFGHVWATIYHVELVPQGGGSPVVVFDDPSGREIDLKTLRDASGARYAFLSTASIPEGVYTGVNITIGSTLQLFRNGVAVGDPIAVDSSVPVDAAGHPQIAVTFNAPRTISATTTTTVCVDFDLARFVLRGSKVIPSIVEGDGRGSNDPARHEKDDYHGTVSGLSGTAPLLSFTLNRGNGMTVAVTTTAATALYGATLAEGSVVEVTGTLDTTSNTLVATGIEVRGAGSPQHETQGDRPRAAGTASSLDAAAGTFTLTIARAHDFTAAQTTVAVVTNASTVFRIDSGATGTQAAVFAALASTPTVAVAGTYDATTNTLTATQVLVTDPSKDRGWQRDTTHFRGHGSDDWGNEAVHHGGNSGHGSDDH